MIKSTLLSMLFLFAILPSSASAHKSLKVGDEVFVCGCGEKCPCDTLSNKGGRCTCAREIKPMVKAKVQSVEDDSTVLSIDGMDRPVITKPKYVCGCASDCNCETASQTPGNCTCGAELKKVH